MKKPKDKVNWKRVWKSFDRWFFNGPGQSTDWPEQSKKLERIVEKDLRRKSSK